MPKMDEVNARLQPQSSICSDSNGEDNHNNDVQVPTGSSCIRLCLIGNLTNDTELWKIAESFNVPVITSKNGQDCLDDNSISTIFIIENFDDDIYDHLYTKLKRPILAPLALKQLSIENKELPDNTRPLFNLAMAGVVVCFTGFRDKEDLAAIVPMVHHMGGSIRRNMSSKVTHLIANSCYGEKYQYAATFRVPAMSAQWVYSSWERRYELDFRATDETFIAQYKLKPFHGAKVCFIGFPEEEEKHMIEVLATNGGTLCSKDDTNCTHIVVDESSISGKPAAPSTKAAIVKAEWFWTSVQKEICLDEKDYLYEDYVEQNFTPNSRRESHQTATPSSASRRKRKRLDTLLSSSHQRSPGLHNKRRSSISDAGLLSVSGSFLDCTTSPDNKGLVVDSKEPIIDTPRKGQTARQQVFLELLQTETNYVDILSTIMTMFKKHLEEMPEHEALLNNTELNLIFGKVPAIYEAHVKMLDELRYIHTQWSEEACIGNVIVKYSNELLKAYPPYINYFEEMKEMLIQCDQTKPRFHAFLKACQTKPECGRQSLQELMIRPVQRLGSICLLLASILKHTQKSNPDHDALEKALAALKKVMDDINEDKRKAEAQVTLFNIFNDIDNCPPDIVSSHRHFIEKAEVIQVTNDGFSRRGSALMLFLFSDQLEICKKKSKAFNNLKSPASSVNSLPKQKLYKHLKLLPLNNIKKVFDIQDSEQCQRVFCLICRNEDGKEKIYAFMMVTDDDVDKIGFLRILTRQMANNACTPDADKFLAYAEAHQLNIDTSDLNNGTFSSKALKLASRTRDKVGRAFSFNKTPSKLKRAMSSMMSPFGSSTNITPASELAQMRLASYSNINELGNAENASESPPVAPMSVQPTRKLKNSVNSLKRV